MRIGIDVDGVLTNLQDYQLKYGKKYFGENAVINENGYDIQDIFGCSYDEREKFWTKYIWNYCLKEPIRPDAIEYINRLKAEGHEIHIITGRAHTTEQNVTGELFRKMLLYKLKKSGINYDSITYCSETKSAKEKLDICKNLNIELMVDDKKENIETLENICKVVCINTKYNEEVKENNNVKKVDTFKELYDIICQYNKNNCVIGDIPFTKDNFKFSYGVVRSLGTPLFKLAFKPTIINKEFIPNNGKVLLCGNHLHVWDQFPVICSTKRTTHWMAKKEYFDGKLGPIFRKTGAICVDRYGNAKQGENQAINYLKIDSAVGMFAEGTRNKLKKNKINEIYEFITSKVGIKYVSLEEFENITKDYLESQVNLLNKLYNNGRISFDVYTEALLSSSLDSYLNLLVSKNVINQEEYEDSLLLPFKFGCVSMAKKTNSPIVPFAVTGDYEIGNDNLMVRYGEPYYVESDDLEKENVKLRNKILKLVIENKKSTKKQ